MMSPGTRLRRGISWGLPSRTTVAVTWIIALSFAAAAPARASCKNRRVTLRRDHARHDASSAWIAGGKGDRRQNRQQNDQRVSKDDQETDEPAALALLRNLVRSFNAPSRLGLGLCEARGSRVQGAKQFIPVFSRCIEDSRGDANVMVLCLCGDLGLIRCGKSRSIAKSAVGHLRESVLGGMIRIRCPHFLRPLTGPRSKLRAEIRAGADETCRNRRRQDDGVAQPRLLVTIPGYSLCFCDFPRFIIQPITVPVAMPAANAIAAVSNGCRSKRLFVL